jgi:hypothetical protein
VRSRNQITTTQAPKAAQGASTNTSVPVTLPAHRPAVRRGCRRHGDGVEVAAPPWHGRACAGIMAPVGLTGVRPAGRGTLPRGRARPEAEGS